MKLLINGGGLVGAYAALLMLKHTNDITVVERRSDLRLASAEQGRSINLILTSRGLFALRALGLEEKALAISVPVEGRLMHGAGGGRTNVTFQPYGVGKHEVNYSVSRTALNQLLIDEGERAGAKYIFDHTLESADISSDKATATFTPRAPAQEPLVIVADVLFGTDGVASAVRREILRHLEGTGATDQVQRLGISYKELTFPADPATKDYSIDKRGLHIWPRGAHFLMALADLTPTFTGTLYLPDGSAPLGDIPDIDAVPSFEGLDNDPAKYKAYVDTAYPDVPALVPDCIEQLTTRPHSILATIRCSQWHCHDRALVFGDAAHGVVPFFGQGMNLGFESAVVLDRFLDAAKAKGGAGGAVWWAGAFEAFQAYHRRSSDAIADMAIENFAEMSFKVGQAEFLRRKHMEHAAEAAAPGAFRSRYFMVTKTLIPYALVKAAGPLIDACVTRLLDTYAARGVADDFEGEVAAEDVVAAAKDALTPFLAKHGIVIDAPLTEYYPSPAA